MSNTKTELANGTIDPAVAARRLAQDTTNQFIDPGSEANAAFLNSATFGLLGHPDPNDAASGKGNSFGALIKDVAILAAIGGALWAFFNFGGTGLLKTWAKKNKYIAAGIIGAAVLLAWFIYSQFKKTASDTQSTASGIADGLKALNPFN